MEYSFTLIDARTGIDMIMALLIDIQMCGVVLTMASEVITLGSSIQLSTSIC